MELLWIIVCWAIGIYLSICAVIIVIMGIYAKVKGLNALIRATYGVNPRFDELLWRIWPDRVIAVQASQMVWSLELLRQGLSNHND